MEWSAQGELTRWVVLSPMEKDLWNGNGYSVMKVEPNGYSVGKFISQRDVDWLEGGGGSMTYVQGDVHPIPDVFSFGTRTKNE